MDDRKKELAKLYIESNSVQFGAFKLSIHNKDSSLQLSPIYLHFPKNDETGSELLPRINDLIGELFFDVIQKASIQYDRIVGVPNGARVLAENLAKRLADWPENLVEFEKHVDNDGKRSFTGPTKGTANVNDRLLLVEDHTSGGYNKSLFVAAAKKSNLTITDILTVVDRQQGAPAYLKSIGITLHSIFKIEELTKFYVEEGLIGESKAQEVHNYLQSNQIVI